MGAVAVKPRAAKPDQHLLVRGLLALVALAAIAFACLILAWPAPFSSTSYTTKTTTEPKKTTTVKEKKTTSPSDALVGAVFGVGVLLLLVAVLFDRLQEIKGPAGTGIVFREPSEEEKEKVAQVSLAMLEEKRGRPPSPEEAALVAVDATAALQAQLWQVWQTSVTHAELRPDAIFVAPESLGVVEAKREARLSDDAIHQAAAYAVSKWLDDGA